jgi:hypothetical protein
LFKKGNEKSEHNKSKFPYIINGEKGDRSFLWNIDCILGAFASQSRIFLYRAPVGKSDLFFYDGGAWYFHNSVLSSQNPVSINQQAIGAIAQSPICMTSISSIRHASSTSQRNFPLFHFIFLLTMLFRVASLSTSIY